MQTTIVICQLWEESERGWSRRPDGFSIHLTEQDRVDFVAAHWDRQPDEIPDVYSFPSNERFPLEIATASPLYQQLLQSKNGVYGQGNRPEEVK